MTDSKNFLPTLLRLKDAATRGPYSLVKGTAGRPTITGNGLIAGRSTIAEFCDDHEGWADARLYLLCRNHADAIAELVQAAEAVAYPSGYRDYLVSHTVLRDALRKLDGQEIGG